jgi:hypothetical protein
MAEFVAFTPGVEVNGQTVLSVVEGCAIKKSALRHLSKNGIVDPEPGKWYSQQAWLDAFRSIATEVGHNTLLLIGRKIPENAAWPPQVIDIHGALASIDIAYHMNHRINGKVLFDPATGVLTEGIGHYGYRKIDDHTARMVCHNPYPCDFDRGIIESAANKFKAAGFRVTVVHDDQAHCRKTGAAECSYTVSWRTE